MSDEPMATRGERDALARSTFAYLASHALGKAVQGIVTPLENLRLVTNEHSLSAEQEACLDLTTAAVDRVMLLCDDIAILTAAASGDLSTAPEEIALATLVRESTERVGKREKIPAKREPHRRLSHALSTLWCDVSLTRRALEALIENALRFSPKDAPVEIETRKRGDWAIISVRDGGAGVAPEIAETIFTPLWSGQRPQKSMGEGLSIGLGLAVARACVEVQGGRLTLEAAGGPGATFSIALPITRPSAEGATSR